MRLLSALCFTIGCLLAGCYPLTGSRPVSVPVPDPPPSQRQPPAIAPSSLTADVVYPTQPVRDQAEARVATQIHAAHAWTDIGDRLQVRFAIHRRPMALAGAGNSLTLSAPFIYKFKARYRLTGGWGPEGSCAWNSDDAFDPPSVAGAVAVSTSFVPRGDWSIQGTSAISNLSMDPCRITFAGFDVSPVIRKVVSDRLGDKLGQLDAALAPLLSFQSQAAKFWAVAQQPIALDPETSITLGPIQPQVSPISFSNDSLYARVGMTLQPALWIRSKPPVQPAPPLPVLAIGNPQPGFVLRTAVVVADSAVARAVAAKAVGKQLRKKWGPFSFYATITKANFYGVGDTAVVSIDLKGKLRGRMYAVGVPTYNAVTRQFTVHDLALTVGSANLLTRLGFHFAKGALLDSLRAVTTLDLGPAIDDARAKLSSLSNRDLDGLRIQTAISDFTPLGIYRDAAGFALLVDLRGTAKLSGLTPRSIAPASAPVAQPRP